MGNSLKQKDNSRSETEKKDNSQSKTNTIAENINALMNNDVPETKNDLPSDTLLSEKKQYIIIFLDVDGVLNNAKSSITELYIIEDHIKELLIQFIRKYTTNDVQPVMVLSSTWRYSEFTRNKCATSFGNDSKYIISNTPNYGNSCPRAYEIVTWLSKNTNLKIKEKYSLNFTDGNFENKNENMLPVELTLLPNDQILDVKSVIIIDDMNFYENIKTLPAIDNEYWKKFLDECYIQIDRKFGLTISDIKKMEQLLF